MRPYPIPAEATRFTEEIKKSRFITLLAPTSGVEAAKAFIQQVRMSTRRRGTIVGPSSPVAPMTHSSWGSPTMENRRAPLANRSSRS